MSVITAAVPPAAPESGSSVRVAVSAEPTAGRDPGFGRLPAELDVCADERVPVAALSEEVPDEPAEPVVSAIAMEGIATTAAPTPNATANAPTRPIGMRDWWG